MAKDDVAGFGKCPFVTSQKLLQGKWSILIMHYLSEGTLRFGELQSRMPEVTHSTLSAQLKRLEEEGLVDRRAYSEVPPRVEYTLTPIGASFQSVLDSIEDWGNEYIAYLNRTADAADVDDVGEGAARS
jgi:DNA-binding HxlR family transcriptional regulator